jgi:enamine deaminase RidA (YjgF/YER057c/UK114 family)
VQAKEARKQVDAAKKATEKNVSMHDQVTRLEEARTEAVQERDASFDTLAKRLLQLSLDDPIIRELNSAERIQRLVNANKCPGKHLRSIPAMPAVEQQIATAAQDLLQTLHNACEEACSRSLATLAAYTAAEGVHATTDINDEDAAEAAWQQLDTAEVAHESAEEAVASATAEFKAMVSMTNQVDKLVVKVVAKTVQVHKVVVQFKDISKEMLRELLSDVCAGFYRAGLLQELIPPSRWHIETLHLILNTGNCWFEVARNVFQYLLTADGNVRDRKVEPPSTWNCASSGSRQSKVWRSSGYDFEALVVKVFGKSMKRPLTKFHGAQIETLFKKQARPTVQFTAMQCSACSLLLQVHLFQV